MAFLRDLGYSERGLAVGQRVRESASVQDNGGNLLGPYAPPKEQSGTGM